MNKVILTGWTTADIEMRTTATGKSFTFFTLALTKTRKEEETTFVSCIAWENTAKLMESYVGKGSKILVEGSISIHNKKDGDNFIKNTNININKLEFLDTKDEKFSSEKKEVKPEVKEEEVSFDDIKF